MTSPTVSIVIPTRNRHELLKDAVASVLSQSYADWELIVVDDNNSVAPGRDGMVIDAGNQASHQRPGSIEDPRAR